MHPGEVTEEIDYILCTKSIVFSLYLEVSLFVCANGANEGSFLTKYLVAAVGALPENGFVLNEYFAFLDILEECLVAFFVFFFDCCYAFKEVSDIVEAFFASCLCEACVHICPFVVFACSCVFKVCSCILNAVMQELKPHLCVFFFVICCL